MVDQQRRAGVLLHPTSLPGSNGIGEFGPAARAFVDWLADAGQSLWQLMPLGPTGYGDSPYQCFSAFAANPLLISLDRLVAQRLLAPDSLERVRALPEQRVEYGGLIPAKADLLKQAFIAFARDADAESRRRFDEFKQRFAGWLDDYALFMALKQFHDGRVWNRWPARVRDRDPEALARAADELHERVEYHRWLQYLAITQWWDVRHYANENGILVLGDLPIFVAYDSADVWANRHLFHLDARGEPTVVAGVPPDYFSSTGQLWGNPLYRWDAHREEDFRWWEARMRATFALVDIVRIDHFRGFAACWEIPAGEETAVNGRWVEAPGHELFETLVERIRPLPVVAENLGVITENVEELRKRFGFPGMRVLQFAWDSGPDNTFLPHNHTPDSVVYTGTHDNNTTAGWFEQEAGAEAASYIRAYAGRELGPIHEELIRLAYGSCGVAAVVPLQDWLGLGPEARMNTPGRAAGNWSWRVRRDQLDGDLGSRMRELARIFGRVPGTKNETETD